VALLVFAANYRKIVEFMRLVGVDDGSRRRPRRRVSRPISDWYPVSTRVSHGPEPTAFDITPELPEDDRG
jgi:hypothetical protein